MRSIDLNNMKKDRKTKYIYLNEDELFYYNDKEKEVTISKYFDDNNVGENVRKVIFKVCGISDAKEFVTDINFEFIGIGALSCFINENTISGTSNRLKTILEIEYERYKLQSLYLEAYLQGVNFDGDTKYINYSEIIDFFDNLKKSNELDKYIKSVTSFMSDGLYFASKRNIEQRCVYEIKETFNNIGKKAK